MELNKDRRQRVTRGQRGMREKSKDRDKGIRQEQGTHTTQQVEGNRTGQDRLDNATPQQCNNTQQYSHAGNAVVAK